MAQASVWREGLRHHYDGAMVVGHDEHERKLYVCRGNLWGRMQLGTTRYGKRHCDIPYSHRVYVVDNFSLLNEQAGYWQPFYGRMPLRAKPLGQAVKRQALYLCRGYYKGAMVAGKTWPKHPYCEVTSDKAVVSLSRFSIFMRA